MKLKQFFVAFFLYLLPCLAMKNQYDQPSENHQELTKTLNNEFKQKAPIKGLVSYIYYPYADTLTGHAELEIGGTCWTIKNDLLKDENDLSKHDQFREGFLEKRLFKTQNGSGLPFYRYVITVTPEQLKQLEENIGKRFVYSFICSYEVLTELAQNTDFHVPFLFKLSPFISSCYLSKAKELKEHRIEKIEFYGNEKTNYLMNMGIVSECMSIVVIVVTTTCYIALTLYSTVFYV